MTAIHRMLWLSTVLSLLPVPASAGDSPAAGNAPVGTVQTMGEQSLDPGTLGKIEGILDFCAKASGQLPAKEGNRAALMLGSGSEEQVAEARDSEDYRDSYDGVIAELDKVPVDQARKACAELPGTGKASRRPAGHRG